MFICAINASVFRYLPLQALGNAFVFSTFKRPGGALGGSSMLPACLCVSIDIKGYLGISKGLCHSLRSYHNMFPEVLAKF